MSQKRCQLYQCEYAPAGRSRWCLECTMDLSAEMRAEIVRLADELDALGNAPGRVALNRTYLIKMSAARTVVDRRRARRALKAQAQEDAA
ncbi:MAG: hypothetical protein AAFQ10_03285 [Pseudomonadota bacterium]